MLYQECYTITEAVLENILAINGTLLFWKHGFLLIVYCTTIWGRAKTKRKMNLTTVEEASEIKTELDAIEFLINLNLIIWI